MNIFIYNIELCLELNKLNNDNTLNIKSKLELERKIRKNILLIDEYNLNALFQTAQDFQFELKDYKKAIEYYNKFNNYYPNFLNCICNLGELIGDKYFKLNNNKIKNMSINEFKCLEFIKILINGYNLKDNKNIIKKWKKYYNLSEQKQQISVCAFNLQHFYKKFYNIIDDNTYDYKKGKKILDENIKWTKNAWNYVKDMHNIEYFYDVLYEYIMNIYLYSSNAKLNKKLKNKFDELSNLVYEKYIKNQINKLNENDLACLFYHFGLLYQQNIVKKDIQLSLKYYQICINFSDKCYNTKAKKRIQELKNNKINNMNAIKKRKLNDNKILNICSDNSIVTQIIMISKKNMNDNNPNIKNNKNVTHCNTNDLIDLIKEEECIYNLYLKKNELKKHDRKTIELILGDHFFHCHCIFVKREKYMDVCLEYIGKRYINGNNQKISENIIVLWEINIISPHIYTNECDIYRKKICKFQNNITIHCLYKVLPFIFIDDSNIYFDNNDCLQLQVKLTFE